MNFSKLQACTILVAALAVALPAVTVAADNSRMNGAEFLVLAKPTKAGGTIVTVDYHSDGSEVGMNLDLDLGSLEKVGVDLSKCSSVRLKAGGNWAGGCSQVDGVVRFVAVNTDLTALPAGWHKLGSFTVKGSLRSEVTAKVAVAADTGSQKVPVGYSFTWVD